LEAERLTLAQTSAHGQHEQCPERVRFRSSEERSHLVGIERLNLPR
jgi:hypothetical protein